MEMTLAELMEILEGFDPDSEILLAQQPNWPFEYSIGTIAEAAGKVYIGEGNQLGYLSGEVKNELGW